MRDGGSMTYKIESFVSSCTAIYSQDLRRVQSVKTATCGLNAAFFMPSISLGSVEIKDQGEGALGLGLEKS